MKPQREEQDRLVPVREIAPLAGADPATVARWVDKGIIPEDLYERQPSLPGSKRRGQLRFWYQRTKRWFATCKEQGKPPGGSPDNTNRRLTDFRLTETERGGRRPG